MFSKSTNTHEWNLIAINLINDQKDWKQIAIKLKNYLNGHDFFNAVQLIRGNLDWFPRFEKKICVYLLKHLIQQQYPMQFAIGIDLDFMVSRFPNNINDIYQFLTQEKNINPQISYALSGIEQLQDFFNKDKEKFFQLAFCTPSSKNHSLRDLIYLVNAYKEYKPKLFSYLIQHFEILVKTTEDFKEVRSHFLGNHFSIMNPEYLAKGIFSGVSPYRHPSFKELESNLTNRGLGKKELSKELLNQIHKDLIDIYCKMCDESKTQTAIAGLFSTIEPKFTKEITNRIGFFLNPTDISSVCQTNQKAVLEVEKQAIYLG